MVQSSASTTLRGAPRPSVAPPRATPVAPAPAVDDGATDASEQDKTLPLPRWLERVYFIFPVILYVPDVIFNYFVYSDGGSIPHANPLLQVSQVVLWAFMSLGIVGMAYLLSVLAPWHWGHGHRIQAVFCGMGVLIATAITTWNSLAFRSTGFATFKTDQWVQNIWPQLSGISLTMVLVAIAPPFWGLFWAVVQPTQRNRGLRHLRESHAERLLRMEQDTELKRLRAESNAKVRAAQLRGTAQTLAAARDQASEFFKRGNTGETAAVHADSDEHGIMTTVTEVSPDDSGGALPAPGNVLQLPTVKPTLPTQGRPVFMNNVAAATPTVHAAPNHPARAVASQPALLSDADAQAPQSGDAAPWGARRPPVPGSGIMGTFFSDEDQMTGTTGPRPAVRRPGDNSTLLRSMSEGVSVKGEALLAEALKELNPGGSKKTISRRELTALLTQKLNGDEATASKLVDQWARLRKNGSGSGRSSQG
jgi:hypothetical protein